MKKFYSLVLMATALLIGTNAWAAGNVAKIGSTEYATLEQAWQAAQNGSTIQMISDANLTHTLWLGTATMEDANPKSITLDLNGKVITVSADIQRAFYLTHGELNITGTGEIHHTDSCASSSYEVFRLGGSTYKTVNPKDENVNYYTHLTIGPNVYVKAKGNAIGVDMMNGWPSDNVKNNAIATAGVTKPTTLFNTLIYKHHSVKDGKDVYSNYGSAYGVRVDVYGALFGNKYAIKANGNLGSPMTDVAWDSNGKTANYNLGDYYKNNPTDATKSYEVLPADNVYTPFIYIHSGADLRVPADNASSLADADKPVAVYCSGYARWKIEGTCVGSTAVYVKSGEVDIKDATIESNYTGNYQKPQETGSGVVSQGSAIVIQSSTAYAGDADVKISGDTKVSATNGYAIEEAITNANGESKVDAITIDGGTFAGGNVGTKEKPEEGTIIITETTVNKTNEEDPTVKTVTIGGLSVTGTGTYVTQDEDGVSIGGQTLADYFASQGNSTHVTTVPDGDGSYTYVITPGPALDEGDDPLVGNMVSEQSTDARIKWTVNTHDTIKTGVSLKLAELEINTEGLAQELVIEDGATFEVGRVVLGPDAKIIVEPGAKFIVSGQYGIVAPVVDNIVLQNEDGKRSIFLFNPEVSSNKHPNATVELITNSWNETTPEAKAQWEMFGIPTHTAVKSISCEKTEKGTKTVYSSIAVYENAAWNNLGFIGGTYTIPVDKLNKPFIAYNLLANRARSEEAPKIKITGELVGNENASLNAYMKWTMFANSYTGEIDGPAFANMLETKAQYVDSYFYVAQASGLGSLTWEPFDAEEKGAKILPMQAFLLNNKGAYAEVDSLNYKKMVYNPAMGITSDPAGAPRRNAVRESTAKMHVVVTSETGTWDKLKLRENANNVKACEKFMNEDVNIYAVVDEKAAIVNAENLDGTYVGFSTVNGGKFTLSFANVEGRDFTLVDHETGAQVLMVEGNTYEFNADANSENDYRFEIVETAKVTTAIDKTEAVKSAKGIYTITGQYVGEMSAWNALPAGVYVVNGEKRVK